MREKIIQLASQQKDISISAHDDPSFIVLTETKFNPVSHFADVYSRGAQIMATDENGQHDILSALGSGDALKTKINLNLKAQGLKESIRVEGDSTPQSDATDDDEDAVDPEARAITKASEHVHEACAEVIVQADGCVLVRHAQTERQIQVAFVKLVPKAPT